MHTSKHTMDNSIWRNTVNSPSQDTTALQPHVYLSVNQLLVTNI